MSKRKMITFDDQMEDDLLYLLTKAREERKKSGVKGQYHEKQLLAELLHNAREIKEAFG